MLATNVAETSLTVPGIRYVIDAGTARISRYSVRSKMQRLPIEAISQASANQRSGRAGARATASRSGCTPRRTSSRRPEFTEPEILRTNLAAVILQMISLGLGDIAELPVPQPPDSRGIKDGLDLLRELGAVERQRERRQRRSRTAITRIGKQLAQLPIDPRFARMVIESKAAGHHARGDGDRRRPQHPGPARAPAREAPAGRPAARPLRRPDERLPHPAEPLELPRGEAEGAQRQPVPAAVQGRVPQLPARARVAGRVPPAQADGEAARPASSATRSTNPDGIHRSLLAGLLCQIGIKDTAKDTAKHGSKAKQGDYIGARQARFAIFPGSALAKKQPAAVMSAELVETSRLFARTNAAIDPAWAEPLAGDLVKRSYGEPHWEKKQGAAVAYEKVTLYGVPIIPRRRVQFARIDPAYARELFIRHALVEGEWDSIAPEPR